MIQSGTVEVKDLETGETTTSFQAAMSPIGTPTEDKKEEKEITESVGMRKITELISDSHSDPAEISRLITAELAVITSEMVNGKAISGIGGRGDITMTDLWKSKFYPETVKALRELGKQLMDTEVLSKKDILQFDGEKFKFCLSRIIDLFVKAMKESGLQEDQRTNVMKHYRDLMAIAEPAIRRDTAKIGVKKS